jgi:two-component system cell cycle response regulator DivK
MSEPIQVLVVEDNPLNLELIRDILELDGMEVEAATSGAAFRARLASPPPDVVLMDILLPDARGEDLFAELRAVDTWAEVPVLAVTAQALWGDLERLRALGFSEVVTKPIDTRGIAPTIRRHAGR